MPTVEQIKQAKKRLKKAFKELEQSLLVCWNLLEDKQKEVTKNGERN